MEKERHENWQSVVTAMVKHVKKPLNQGAIRLKIKHGGLHRVEGYPFPDWDSKPKLSRNLFPHKGWSGEVLLLVGKNMTVQVAGMAEYEETKGRFPFQSTPQGANNA